MKDHLPFIDKRLSIKSFDDIGMGVVATSNIEGGIFVEFAPVVVCENNSISFDKEVFKYVIAWGNGLAVPFGWTMFYNHSDHNNCEFSVNLHDGLLAIQTLREIEEGEQLTVNYGPNWFSSRKIEKKAT
jgi:hypothetical protein